jgi:hypothetical protein
VFHRGAYGLQDAVDAGGGDAGGGDAGGGDAASSAGGGAGRAV